MLPDITQSDGKRFLPQVLLGQATSSCSSLRHLWPKAAKPSRSTIRLWKSALRLTYATQSSDHIDPINVTSLWLNHAQPFLQWWHSEVTNSIYKRVDSGWRWWDLAPNERRITRHSQNTFLPTSCFTIIHQTHWVSRTSAPQRGNHISRTYNGHIEIRNESPSDSVDNAWTKQGWPIRTMKLPDDGGIKFIFQLQQPTAKIVCDRSFKWCESISASYQLWIIRSSVPMLSQAARRTNQHIGGNWAAY